eukprot:1900561-Amphidinium_carterae.1
MEDRSHDHAQKLSGNAARPSIRHTVEDARAFLVSLSDLLNLYILRSMQCRPRISRWSRVVHEVVTKHCQQTLIKVTGTVKAAVSLTFLPITLRTSDKP